MEVDTARQGCVRTGPSNSLEEVSVKFSCFGLGKKKAKPLALKDEATSPGSGESAPWRKTEFGEATQSTENALKEDPRCGDASPRTWIPGSKHDIHAFAESLQIPRHEIEQQQSDEEGNQMECNSYDGNLTMHDSTSSLKEGLHGKIKADLAAKLMTQKEIVSEVEDEEEENYLRSEWEINPRDIFFCSRSNGKLCRLGKGAFGTVYKGVWQGDAVAVKVCRHQHVSLKAMKQFQKEVAILNSCAHENIVQFKGACCWKGGKRTVLVTEYMDRGDLCTAIGRSPGKYSWHRLGKSIALDVAKGLAFLHRANIVHFDLKSANILLAKNGGAKLADVGLAKTLTHHYGTDHLSTFMATGDLGTFAWAAPEVLLGFPCDAKADIFSFGVVMWELATTEMPQGRCLRPIRTPEEASEEVADLIMDCLRHDPKLRPSADLVVHILGGMQ